MHGTGWSWLPYLQGITSTSLKQVTITVSAGDQGDEPEPTYTHTLDDIEKLVKK